MNKKITYALIALSLTGCIATYFLTSTVIIAGFFGSILLLSILLLKQDGTEKVEVVDDFESTDTHYTELFNRYDVLHERALSQSFVQFGYINE